MQMADMTNDTFFARSKVPVRIHLTNVTGAGASQVLQSLLPALESDLSVTVERIDLPDRGKLADYSSNSQHTVVQKYRRRLPNVLSRLLECTLFANRFEGESPLLVLGDLPLRCRGPQTVFVQTPHLIIPSSFNLFSGDIKYWVSRLLFWLGIDRVRAFIVQTDVMRDRLERSYPRLVGKVHVIGQPAPAWLLNSGLRRHNRIRKVNQALSLIYPAACYPHKNHAFLSRIDPCVDWPVERLVLTLDPTVHPAPHLSWVNCIGFLTPENIIEAYSDVDALLFLSKDESYGLPLIEAMYVGLPIVCPDLPYARTLCGEGAFYFDSDRPESLREALTALKSKLDNGWWPDWQCRLSNIPADWNAVAQKMLEVACTGVQRLSE